MPFLMCHFGHLEKILVPKLWQGILVAKKILSVQNGTLAKWHLRKMAPYRNGTLAKWRSKMAP